MRVLVLLLVALNKSGRSDGHTAQQKGDVLQLKACGDDPTEHFAQHYEVLGDGRNWTTIRPATDASLCVSVCSSCDPEGSGQFGRLQLQQCSQASDAQAWSLVPVAGSSDTLTVQTAKAFVQSQKCTVWNICPVDSSSKRLFEANDTMIPYPQCDPAGAWNEIIELSAGGVFKPSSAAHNKAGVCIAAVPPPPPPHRPPGWSNIPLPTPAQLAWSRHEITAIGHFLPLCGHGDMQNNASWTSRGCGAPFAADCMAPKEFNPKGIDTDGWVKAVASMGAKVAVFVVRHGCGFDLWPTKAKLPSGFKYEYSIANAPYKGGQGDLAAEFVASCKKYNVTPGFYAAVANNAYLNVTGNKLLPGAQLTLAEYQDITLQQLKELWTNYGQIGEIWFDGGIPDAFAANILALFKQLQPNAVMFQGPGKDAVRWAGTEGGSAPADTWSTSATVMAYGAGDPNAGFFFPANCDTTLQEQDQWAYNPKVGLRTLKELIGVYHGTVGRNCNLELDWAPFMAGPDSGTLPPDQVKRFEEFGEWIEGCYGDGNRVAHTGGNTSVVPGGSAEGTSSLVLQLPAGGGIDAPKPIDRVVIEEDQAYGQRILAWNVSTDTGVVLGSGKSVGNKRILVWNSTALPADAKQLVLGVTTAKAQPVIRNFAAFRSCPVE
jgi:alpha-L-fucosidase